MGQKLSLVEWHKELQRIAEEKGFGFVISDDPADHVDGYNDDNSPEMEMDSQLDAWSDG